MDEARVNERVVVDQLVFQREVLGRELAKSVQAHLFDYVRLGDVLVSDFSKGYAGSGSRDPECEV